MLRDRERVIQCPLCSSWVCRERWWNEAKGRCKECAPDPGVEMTAAHVSCTVEKIRAHSRMAEKDRKMLKEKNWRAGIRAICPSCGVPLKANGKFCREYGAKIAAEVHCAGCGAKLSPGAKFHAECEAKVAKLRFEGYELLWLRPAVPG